MSILNTIKSEFHTTFPRLASGKYVHFLMLRHSQSFPVFQTDGVLNTARTQAGLETPDPISRLVMFKRKQVTPERLAGRELLRSLGLTSADSADKDKFCEYNGEGSCKKCPDCIIYGFAIGDSGSERSKVYSDSAFSLSAYEQSHRSFTFNAPFEGGTMSEKGVMRTAINELDHVLPEISFPTVETLRDPTFEGFLYVLGNLLRTRRYGAQESRTGTMSNHIIGIVLCDGEIFSNLHFTQALYDGLKPDFHAPIADIIKKAIEVTNNLLNNEPVRKNQVIMGSQLTDLLTEVSAIYQDESQLKSTISTLYQQTKAYAETFGAVVKKAKGNK
jgi:CRISPR-associated protein Csc2